MKFLLSVLAYAVATFAVQATSHFAVNAAHYASVPHVRKEPVFALGVGAMLIQGTVLAWLYPRCGIRKPLLFAWALGAFAASYLALAEPAKYAVPSIGPWIAVEAVAGFAQFTLYGLFLSIIHREATHGVR